MTTTPHVLFVCLHGSAKSLIALEHFRRLADEQGMAVAASFAGTEPDAEIPPKVVQGLLADGLDVRGRRPLPLTREDLERASKVVSFGCDLGALAPRGLAIERWDDMPAVSEDFAKARDAIVARLRQLLDTLAVPSRA